MENWRGDNPFDPDFLELRMYGSHLAATGDKESYFDLTYDEALLAYATRIGMQDRQTVEMLKGFIEIIKNMTGKG